MSTLPVTSQNPFEVARLALIARLNALTAPKSYPLFPSPSDHQTIADHIREAADIFDEWLAAIGSEVRDNAVTSISSSLFSGSFSCAVDGNETYACEEQGQALREHSAERRTERRSAW